MFTSNMDSGAEAIRQGGMGPAEAAALYWNPGVSAWKISIPKSMHGSAI